MCVCVCVCTCWCGCVYACVRARTHVRCRYRTVGRSCRSADVKSLPPLLMHKIKGQKINVPCRRSSAHRTICTHGYNKERNEYCSLSKTCCWLTTALSFQNALFVVTSVATLALSMIADSLMNCSWETDQSQQSYNTVAAVLHGTLEIRTAAHQWPSSRTESLRNGNEVHVKADKLSEDLKSAATLRQVFESASWATLDECKQSRKSEFNDSQ